MLVVAILTVLGISFLIIADTENRIAENERMSAQALYFAETGARAVIQWFDEPGSPANLANPPVAAAERTLREIDDDGDPATAPHRQDGTLWPRYKQDVDANADGVDDLFDRPYRTDLRNTFLGTPGGPDLRIDAAAAGPGRDFLEALSLGLGGGDPSAGSGVYARLEQIDVYAPPYLRIGGDWTRFGIATVAVVARMYRGTGGGTEILAERVVKVVLNEIPYAVPFGAVHSCGNFSQQGPFPFRWGATAVLGDATLEGDHTQVPASLARDVPAGVKLDLLWFHADDASFSAYRSAIDGLPVEDPWLRILASGSLTRATGVANQPTPPQWPPGPLPPDQRPAHLGGIDGSHSNQFQFMPLVDCPTFQYDSWKSIATSGREGVEYYVWDSDDRFRRDGLGTPRSFRDITDVPPADPSRRPALFFFDTRDALPPRDDDGDGRLDNLTPPIVVRGGEWGARGFVYLNAESFQTSSVVGRSDSIRAPGEPWQDRNADGQFDDEVESWINLRYPTALGDPIVADLADTFQDDGTTPGGAAVRNAWGPWIAAEVAMHGILYTSGAFDSGGSGVYFGSVIAGSGVREGVPAAGGVRAYWDDSIRRGEWPPAAWRLPRVTASRWETDL